MASPRASASRYAQLRWTKRRAEKMRVNKAKEVEHDQNNGSYVGYDLRIVGISCRAAEYRLDSGGRHVVALCVSGREVG